MGTDDILTGFTECFSLSFFFMMETNPGVKVTPLTVVPL